MMNEQYNNDLQMVGFPFVNLLEAKRLSIWDTDAKKNMRWVYQWNSEVF